jgi:FkbM family methyltransferase
MLKSVLRALLNAALATPILHWLARAMGRAGLLPQRVWAGYPLEKVARLRAGGTQFRYHISPGDYVGMPLYWRGEAGYEPETLSRMAELLRECRVFYDIGANTGLFSLLVAQLKPEVRIVAFEPNPQTYARLSENIALNSLGARITALHAAIGLNDGLITLHVPNGEFALSSTLAPEGQTGDMPGHRPVEVPCRSIVSVLTEFLPPDVIKIDAEGYEAAILESMADFLARYRPQLLIEVLDDAPFARLEAALRPAGYRFARLGNGPLVWRDTLALRGSDEGRNVLCRVNRPS